MVPADLRHGDCLEVMATLPDASVDMILCDLPYGTTACKWDTVIPFEPLWAQYRRVAKRNAAIVLTASQPFTTALIASNMREFRYTWVWDKGVAANFPQAKQRPLKVHEDVCVFSAGSAKYLPQMTAKDKPVVKQSNNLSWGEGGIFDLRGTPSAEAWQPKTYTESYPSSIVKFSSRAAGSRGLHPTQKPVALMEYLIRTYTQEGDVVLDNCMGSGTTGVACANTGRRFVGIERDDKYFAIASERISNARRDLSAA